MSSVQWVEPLVSAAVDGPTLTSAAAASALLSQMRVVLDPAFFDRIGKTIRIRAAGRISCVATTPGTARFDVRLGGTVVWDSLAIPLSTAGRTNTGWWLEVMLTSRAIGASGNLIGQGMFTSQATIGAPGDAVSAPGAFLLPYNSAPAVGSNFDTTAAQLLDLFFTQTVATGSLTVHQYEVYG